MLDIPGGVIYNNKTWRFTIMQKIRQALGIHDRYLQVSNMAEGLSIYLRGGKDNVE